MFLLGLRANYWDFNEELLLSPRLGMTLIPDWERDYRFKLSHLGFIINRHFIKNTVRKEERLTITSKHSNQFILWQDSIISLKRKSVRLNFLLNFIIK